MIGGFVILVWSFTTFIAVNFSCLFWFGTATTSVVVHTIFWVRNARFREMSQHQALRGGVAYAPTLGSLVTLVAGPFLNVMPILTSTLIMSEIRLGNVANSSFMVAELKP